MQISFSLRLSDTDRKRLKREINPFRSGDIELLDIARLNILRLDSETCRSDLKPDIVLLDKSSKTAVIVEITVSFKGPNSTLKATREAKRDKYRVFEPELKRLGYKKIVVDALVVGALEAFDPDNSRVLSALKILRRYVRLIKGSQYLGRSRKAEIFTYSHNLS